MTRPDLERLFRAEYTRVVALAQRVLGDGGQAEDVAQEVFAEFAYSDVPGSRASQWLTVAATHRALNLLRAGRRRADREFRAGQDPSLAPPQVTADIADDVLRGAERGRIRAALSTLPAKQATALLLRYSGLSYAEIAQELDMSATGVGTTLRRAETALRKELIRDGSFE